VKTAAPVTSAPVNIHIDLYVLRY